MTYCTCLFNKTFLLFKKGQIKTKFLSTKNLFAFLVSIVLEVCNCTFVKSNHIKRSIIVWFHRLSEFLWKSMWSEAVLQISNDLNSLFFSHYINNFRHKMYIKNFKNMQTLFYVKLFKFAEWVFCLTCSPKLNRKENNVKCTGYTFWDRLRNFLHKFTWIVLSVHKFNKLDKFW